MPDQRSLAEAYDQRYAGDYMSSDPFSRWSHAGVERRRVRDTLEAVPAGEVRSILDYGCGRGEWLDELAGAFPGAEVSGADISAEAIRRGRAAWPGRRLVSFDGGRAPFPDASFDLVFSYHVLEHVLLFEESVADMVRLARPGGHLCVIFPCGNEGSFEERLARQVEGGIEPGAGGATRFWFEDPLHLRRLPADQVIRAFESRGAALVREYYAHQRFGAIEWICASGRGFVSTMFPARRGRTLAARGRIALTGKALWCLAAIVDLSRLDPGAMRPGARRLLARALRPARTAGGAVARGLQDLALREWRRSRTLRHGSAQFLVFRRALEAPR